MNIRVFFALTALSAAALFPVAAFADDSGRGGGNDSFTQQVTVQVTSPSNGVSSLPGTLSVARFTVVNNQLMAIGNLAVQVRDTAGNLQGTITLPFQTPVTTPGAGSAAAAAALNPGGFAPNAAALAPAATCSILNLTLGPIHLNLLGLVVDTNPIVLNITAQSGPGNLLGNLLCGVANLLNTGGPLTAIANLLNQILAAL